MKVLVTGANGFIGRNLITRLKEEENIEIIAYDKENTIEEIESCINEIDFIFHLAGVNRPVDTSEFYSGNSDLTKTIVDMLNKNNLETPIVVTSSIQAELDNDYGKSKKMAEDIIKEYKKGYIYRLHNVFGKWSRPNYNSVIATFCHNIANNIEIKINDQNAEINLIYIDDIIEEFLKIMYDNKPTDKNEDYCYINPRYNVTLGYIASLIYSFKESMTSIYAPNVKDEFTKKLFSTYLSYVPHEDMTYVLEKHTDDRGSFVELIRTAGNEQFSISTSKPGVKRGNHYHHTKVEKFIVIKGTALIKLKDIITDEITEWTVNSDKIELVTIPVGYTHSIENIGKDEMILAIWCNEVFNQNKPDTYYREV